MSISFSIQRDELLRALTFLSPFVYKGHEEIVDEDEEYYREKPIEDFCDKVTFLFYEDHLCLSVLADKVKASRTCSYSSDNQLKGSIFCMSHAYLEKSVQESVCEILSFIEDKFYGFIAYDKAVKTHLFDIAAYSVRLQKDIHPKCYETLYPNVIHFERNFLISTLDEFAKYTQKGVNTTAYNSIWYLIDNGICTVFATNGGILRLNRFQTDIKGKHTITFPSLFVERIIELVSKWDEYTSLPIGYNNDYCHLYSFRKMDSNGEELEFPLNHQKIPNINLVLDNKTIIHKVETSVSGLLSIINRVKSLDYGEPYIIMHFFSDHVNIFSSNRYHDSYLCEFLDIDSSEQEFVLRINWKELECLLNEIVSEHVTFIVVERNIVYIIGDDEQPFGDIIRIISSAKINDDAQKTLEQGDASLRNHPEYIKKYIREHKQSKNYLRNKYKSFEEGLAAYLKWEEGYLEPNERPATEDDIELWTDSFKRLWDREELSERRN